MEEKIKEIISQLFGIEKSRILDNSSQETIEQWDSLGHLNLITSLEEEFQVQFNEEEISQMLNLKLIVEIISEARRKAK